MIEAETETAEIPIKKTGGPTDGVHFNPPNPTRLDDPILLGWSGALGPRFQRVG